MAAGPEGPRSGSRDPGFIPVGARAGAGAFPPAQLIEIGLLALVLSLTALPAQSAADLEGEKGERAPHRRIVNGLTTSDFPTTGALLYSDAGTESTAQSWCSGTLIGCQTFLTAAHCFSDDFGPDLDPTHYFVFLQNAGFFAVESIALNPDYATVVDENTVIDGEDGLADIAVAKLAEPVTGVSPQPLLTTDPFSLFGTAGTYPGTIVGFGITEGSASDLGLKRWGRVVAEACPEDLLDEPVGERILCWPFADPIGSPGEDSNTCSGDSGGPLFFTVDDTEFVAGVTQAGSNASCRPGPFEPDTSWDASVYYYGNFVQNELGQDSTQACGNVTPVGATGTSVVAFEGTLSVGAESNGSFEVLEGTRELRVVMNGIDDYSFDPDLRVQYGAPPENGLNDCTQIQAHPYGACTFSNPQAGIWYLEVENAGDGSGTYQATVTRVPEPGGPTGALVGLLALSALRKRAAIRRR